MISQKELETYLNQLLRCESFQDYAPNGLQVEGTNTITRICTAVTAGEEVIDQAIALNADALIVHHGYFWRGESSIIVGMKRQRLRKLLQHNLNLFAYHLPLDCHTEMGNNACLAKLLQIHDIKMHSVANTANLLWSGTLHRPMSSSELKDFIGKQLGRDPLLIQSAKNLIHTISWCSGGAQDYILEANRLGVDAYLSGEVSERTYYQAKELNINYYACGHHATERYGIQALGNHLAAVFELECSFLDCDNPI